MDITAILPWLVAISTLISIGTAVTVFFTSGAKHNEKKLIEHDRRIQAIEGEMKHLPNKDTVNELKLALADVRGTVNTLSETVGSVSRTVHRIDDYLRQKAEA